MKNNILEFYKGKRVLITGHTGFKGSWLCQILKEAGAVITGYALLPPTEPALFYIMNIEEGINSIIGDIRDYESLYSTFEKAQPEIVFHLAAQPLVRESYKDPRLTYETNVMGTVNVCECVRKVSSVRTFLNVTTDKVYKNNEWEWGYREEDILGGYDPYSNSKSCSELVTQSYINSFFHELKLPVSTARAGNVIGGGDFAKDRIIPDCVRAAVNQEDIIVRNSNSVRPYQHVLEPLMAYLLIALKQYESIDYADTYNVGPEENDCISTGELADLFCFYWGNNVKWNTLSDYGPHESNFLKLDCSRLKYKVKWKPVWNVNTAVQKTVEWTECYYSRGDIQKCMNGQIQEFFEQAELI